MRYVRSMSAIPPKADIRQRDWHLRFVPMPDMLTLNARVLSAQYSSKDIRRLSRFHVSCTKPRAIPTKITIFQWISGNLYSKQIAARAAFDQDQGVTD